MVNFKKKPPRHVMLPICAFSAAKNFLWNQSNQILTIISGVLLARFLGPHDRGLLAAAILWPSMVANMGLIGIPTAATLQVRRNPENTGEIASSTFKAIAVLASCEVVLFYFLLPVLIPDSAKETLQMSRLFLMTVPISHIGIMVTTFFMALGWMNYNGVLMFLNTMTYVAFLVLYWFLDKINFSTAIYALMAGIALSTVVGIIMFMAKIGIGKATTGWINAIKDGHPFFVEQVLVMITRQIEQWLLLYYLSPIALGYYVISKSYAGLSGSFINSITGVYFVKSAHIFFDEQGKKQLVTIFKQSILIFLLPIMILMAMGPLAIPLIFGAAYSSSVNAALILLIAMLIQGLSDLLLASLRSTGHAVRGGLLRLPALCILVITAPLLIKYYGISGCSISFLLSTTTQLVSVFLYLSRFGFCVRSFFAIRFVDIKMTVIKIKDIIHVR